jgi:catalase-peroxidase
VRPEITKETFIWKDPVPAADYQRIDIADVAQLKSALLASGLTVPELVRTAWASAVTYRDTDKRGGANGARLRLAPQKDWAVNDPAELARVLGVLERIQKDFNARSGKKQVSLADVIVLGGATAIEKAARDGGLPVTVPFTPGRTDATQAQTDIGSFAMLEPQADGFRNYHRVGYAHPPTWPAGTRSEPGWRRPRRVHRAAGDALH